MIEVYLYLTSLLTVPNLCKQEDLRQFILDAHQQYSSGGVDLK
jgi:prenyltransferase beta subunit